MTPVMEQLVRPPSDAPAKREAQMEPQPDGERGQQPSPEGEDAEADKAMSTSEAERGQGSPDDVAQQTASQGEEDAPPGAAEGRSDDAEGGGSDSHQTGLGECPTSSPSRPNEDLGEQVFHYDEWDHKIEDYRPAWCVLTEHRQTRTQEGFVAATFYEFGGVVTQIRRNFQLMRPEALRKMRRQEDGDDLDTDGLVEYVVDRGPSPPRPASTSSATSATAMSRRLSSSTCRARPTARSTGASASSTSKRRPCS
jgi:hypothetical protein